MENNICSISLSKLIPHPANPNSMSESNFRKLVRNIEKTGLYEPIVVRRSLPIPGTGAVSTGRSPEKKNCFQIINGHHRVKALEKLGRKEAYCVVWDVDDEQTEILLATLNRLCGSDLTSRKIELLKGLSSRLKTAELAKLLPQTKKQIERLINLKLTIKIPQINAECLAIPLVFFVTKHQQEIIEKAIASAYLAPGFTRGAETSRPQRRAAAITEIAERFAESPLGAEQFLRNEKCQTQNS